MQWAPSTAQLAALIPLTVVSVDVIRRLVRDRIERKGYPLPPGPTPLPFIGNALSVNIEEPYITYTEWRGKYGDVIYLRMLDMDVLVLNSVSAATDLLEKRSHTYSDRPTIATTSPFGHDFDIGFAKYGDHWRLCRRIFQQTFRVDAVPTFHPMLIRKARQTVLNMMDNPRDYTSHYSTFSAAITMSSIYDYEPSLQNDPIVSTAKNFLDASVPALMPEKAILIKYFPFLLHIPDWLPGSGIQRASKRAREYSDVMVNAPYEYVQKRMQSEEGTKLSMVSDHITRLAGFDEPYRSAYEKALKHIAATAILGSVETTTSVLSTFTLAMVKHPRVWKRAQAEIDAIVGTDKLPDFDDRSSLPYVDAIVREAFRWQPPGPLAVPHSTTTSDIYDGYYIPKGTVVFGNVWAMSRDETRYPNPEEFIPERFLDEEGMLTDDIPDFVFGFGRRVCPGRHTAIATTWGAVATMLATLDFNPAKDELGKDIQFEAKFSNGISRHPLPFPCHITPREHVNREFIERALDE